LKRSTILKLFLWFAFFWLVLWPACILTRQHIERERAERIEAMENFNGGDDGR